MNRVLFVDIRNEVVVLVEGEHSGNPPIYVRRKSNSLNVSQPGEFWSSSCSDEKFAGIFSPGVPLQIVMDCFYREI